LLLLEGKRKVVPLSPSRKRGRKLEESLWGPGKGRVPKIKQSFPKRGGVVRKRGISFPCLA